MLSVVSAEEEAQIGLPRGLSSSQTFHCAAAALLSSSLCFPRISDSPTPAHASSLRSPANGIALRGRFSCPPPPPVGHAPLLPWQFRLSQAGFITDPASQALPPVPTHLGLPCEEGARAAGACDQGIGVRERDCPARSWRCASGRVLEFAQSMMFIRCFRDEDLIADRQPEFTQPDIELAFAPLEDILKINEDLIRHIFKEIKGIHLPEPFPRLAYAEAMGQCGSDRPDTRFAMELKDVTSIFSKTTFKVFADVLALGGL